MARLHSQGDVIEIYEDESIGRDETTHEEPHEIQSYEEQEDNAEDPFDDEHDDHADSDDDDDHDGAHDFEDPFSSSELSASHDDYDVNIQSHAVKSSARGSTSSHSHDYSFSRTTPVHLDNRIDPLLDYSENLENEANQLAEDTYGRRDVPLDTTESRKVSESVSTLPDELEYYRSSLPGRSPLSLSKSHQGSRHGSVTTDRGLLYSPSPRPHQHSMSTPTAIPLPPSTQHSRSNSAVKQEMRPVFRNPSSIRAMQLSSPSPPPFESSPLSGRKLRKAATPQRQDRNSVLRHSLLSNSGLSARHSPRQQSARQSPQRKEYPLVLLHCTLSLLPMPFEFPLAALEAIGASERVKKDLALLSQKLDDTVLERGLLISHPGDDYDLLEERVLESLELTRPRVGGCGHFRSASYGSDTGTARADTSVNGESLTKCQDCSGHISPVILRPEEHGKVRRWDMRIYAANGLMRSGAWSAAWREMEKVDVEIGIWMPDELKGKLDEYAAALEAVERDTEQIDAQRHGGERVVSTGSNHQRARGSKAMPEDRTEASTATTSRAMSVVDAALEPAQHSRHASSSSERRGAGTDAGAMPKPSEVPLGTLLYNHVLRQFGKYSDLLLPSMVVALAVCLALRSFQTQPAVAPAVPAPIATLAPLHHNGAEAAQGFHLSACTFAPSALSSPESEMTAVPRRAAEKILHEMAHEMAHEAGHSVHGSATSTLSSSASASASIADALRSAEPQPITPAEEGLDEGLPLPA